jgi:hypothetical protein
MISLVNVSIPNSELVIDASFEDVLSDGDVMFKRRKSGRDRQRR